MLDEEGGKIATSSSELFAATEAYGKNLVLEDVAESLCQAAFTDEKNLCCLTLQMADVQNLLIALSALPAAGSVEGFLHIARTSRLGTFVGTKFFWLFDHSPACAERSEPPPLCRSSREAGPKVTGVRCVTTFVFLRSQHATVEALWTNLREDMTAYQ